MKNLVNALGKFDKIMVNETGICAAKRDFSMKFIGDNFIFNEEDTREVEKKIFKKSMDIIDFKLGSIELNRENKVTLISRVDNLEKIKMICLDTTPPEPRLPKTKVESSVEIDTDKLIECLPVSYGSYDNMSVYGVRVDKIGYTSTDTYRLYNIKDDSVKDVNITIPDDVINFLKTCKASRIVNLKKYGREYCIKLDYGTLYFTPVELAFPDAQNIIRTSNSYCDKEYTINKKLFGAILKKGMKVENEDIKYGATFTFKKQVFEISVKSEIMEFETRGMLISGYSTDLKINLNQKFLQSALTRIKSDDIILSGSNSSSMIKIQGEDKNRVEIIMPLAMRD